MSRRPHLPIDEYLQGGPTPDPRDDGYCCGCHRRVAVTRDHRFCKPCLNRVINHDTPMIGCYVGLGRTAEHRQSADECSSPWGENAIRCLEDQ